MDAEKYEEAVRDYEKITKMDHNHGICEIFVFDHGEIEIYFH